MKHLPPRRFVPALLAVALVAIAGWWAMAWCARNGLPDGYQNEYLHAGNALDLWDAWRSGDGWLVRYLLDTNYWPPGFYLWPWPLFALLGAGHRAMILAGLGHFALLLWCCFRLGEELRGRATGMLAMSLVALLPGIAGNLVRYEPNVAVAAWVCAGALCLARSRGFEVRRWSLAFGIACGIGLMMDRLSLAVFLGPPAVLELVAGLRRGGAGRRLRHVALALAALLLVSGWWYWQFVHRHVEEVLSQAPVGEIDSTGHMTEHHPSSDPATWLYYVSALLDGQAGLLPGVLLLAGLAAGIARGGRRRVPVAVALSGMAVFTLVQKKQVFYTLPALGPLAVLGADLLASCGRARAPLAGLVLLAGLHQLEWRMWGVGLPLPAPWAERLGGQLLPDRWVLPRHPQARPPRDLRLPVDEVAAALGDGPVVVFSEDATWFEGFLVLQVRERLPGRKVRGLLVDPQGTYEWFRASGSFVHVVTDAREGWPDEAHLEAALLDRDYDLAGLPPVVELVASSRARFHLAGRWPLPQGGEVRVYRAGPGG